MARAPAATTIRETRWKPTFVITPQAARPSHGMIFIAQRAFGFEKERLQGLDQSPRIGGVSVSRNSTPRFTAVETPGNIWRRSLGPSTWPECPVVPADGVRARPLRFPYRFPMHAPDRQAGSDRRNEPGPGVLSSRRRHRNARPWGSRRGVLPMARVERRASPARSCRRCSCRHSRGKRPRGGGRGGEKHNPLPGPDQIECSRETAHTCPDHSH